MPPSLAPHTARLGPLSPEPSGVFFYKPLAGLAESSMKMLFNDQLDNEAYEYFGDDEPLPPSLSRKVQTLAQVLYDSEHKILLVKLSSREEGRPDGFAAIPKLPEDRDVVEFAYSDGAAVRRAISLIDDYHARTCDALESFLRQERNRSPKTR